MNGYMRFFDNFFGFFKNIGISFYDSVIYDDRYKYILDGLFHTILIALFAVIIGIVLGIVIALIRHNHDINGKMRLGNNKTYTLNSGIIKFIPKYLIRDFLRGYFDGDGNVMYGKKYNSGTKYNINICGNEDFLLNTYQKYFPSINKMYYDKKSRQTYIWKISSKKKVEEFLYYLYCNSSIHLKRKYKVYLESKHAHLKLI